ncbi:M12 family metallopeptidase [uncultured Aquimarina sp.]|uniref:M12 family metallopeptidase n=1 Tax=uncultured Aquimarina sp. TaxID=575652 RepID=UPI002602AF68|nr:M12 family metallopeptidase [uncultured Aquimarina sp.]
MKNKKSLYILLCFLFLLISCQKENFEDSVDDSIITSEAMLEVYKPISKETSEIVTKSFFGSSMDFEFVDGNYILGDMILSEDQITKSNSIEKGTILNNVAKRWPKSGGIYLVTYSIDGNLPNKQRVTNAIAHWEANTKIRFVNRIYNPYEPNYIYFTNNGGCSSKIGKVGGQQIISLGNGCSTGNTIHEIGHAVGMFHEQSHPQRWRYVDIKWENIEDGKEGNFVKRSYPDVKTTRFNFNSVMMYGSYFFSKNGLPTILKEDGSTFSVQRNGLSNRDKKVINKIYE